MAGRSWDLEHEVAAVSSIADVLGGVRTSAHLFLVGVKHCFAPCLLAMVLWLLGSVVTSSHLMASLLLACPMSVWLKCFWLSCRDFS